MTAPNAEPTEDFLREYGEALHTNGVPTHRLETALEELADRFGMRAQFMSTPTSLMCAFGPPNDQRLTLARLSPGSTNMGGLCELDFLGQEVFNGGTSPAEGLGRLRALRARGGRYGRGLTLLAWPLSSLATAHLLDGGAVDLLASALAGAFVGLADLLTSRDPSQRRVLLPLGGLIAALIGALAAPMGGSGTLITLAGVLVLLPGLSLTVAMNELGTGHLVAGTSRLAGAVVALLQLAFGVFTGQIVSRWLPPALPHHATHLAQWADGLALIGMAIALVVLFQARLRDGPWLLLGVVAAWATSRLATDVVEPALVPFLGALFVTIIGNVMARLRHQPASLVVLPGVLMLVPGSVGLRGMNTMLSDTVTGVDLLFKTGFVAVAIVAGSLVAGALVSSRRSL